MEYEMGYKFTLFISPSFDVGKCRYFCWTSNQVRVIAWLAKVYHSNCKIIKL